MIINRREDELSLKYTIDISHRHLTLGAGEHTKPGSIKQRCDVPDFAGSKSQRMAGSPNLDLFRFFRLSHNNTSWFKQNHPKFRQPRTPHATATRMPYQYLVSC